MANADGPNPRLLSELLLNSPEAKIAISIASEAPIEVPSPRGGGATAALEQSPRGHRVGRWLRQGNGTQRGCLGPGQGYLGPRSLTPSHGVAQGFLTPGSVCPCLGTLVAGLTRGLRRTVPLLRAACRTRALPCPHLRARRWKSSAFAVGIAERWLETAHV